MGKEEILDMRPKSSFSQDMPKKEEKTDILEFVSLKIPTLIPKDLIENVKGRTFTVEQFYKYQQKHLKDPDNHLYAIVDAVKKIQGYIWADVKSLDNSLRIESFSITKEYWEKGKFMENVGEFLKELKFKVNCDRIFWNSTNEKFFMKHGFKRSRISLLEYNAD